MAQITVTLANHFTGTQRHVRLLGGPGGELVGSVGDDDLLDGGGNELDGGAASDLLFGGAADGLLLRGSGNDTLADGPGDDRSRGDGAVTTYLDEEPVAEPTTWALWSGLFGIGLLLLSMLLLALWYNAFPLRRARRAGRSFKHRSPVPGGEVPGGLVRGPGVDRHDHAGDPGRGLPMYVAAGREDLAQCIVAGEHGVARRGRDCWLAEGERTTRVGQKMLRM